MTETNGPIAPLQSEIAELRKRVSRLEVSFQIHMDNDLDIAHPDQIQPDGPQGVETAEDFVAGFNGRNMVGKLNAREEMIRADERRTYQAAIEAERAIADDFRAKLEATERERDELKALCDKLARRADAAGSELDRARAVVETARLALQHDHVDTDGTFDALREALRAFDAKG